MLVELLKWQSVLLVIILSSVACSKDSDEEYSGGGTTASSAKILVSSTITEDHGNLGVTIYICCDRFQQRCKFKQREWK